jgi:hypothetical protein
LGKNAAKNKDFTCAKITIFVPVPNIIPYLIYQLQYASPVLILKPASPCDDVRAIVIHVPYRQKCHHPFFLASSLNGFKGNWLIFGASRATWREES